MFIAILTLLSALSISAIAAFYSIVGLATIFPGAYWPVVAMGSALEAGKLVCASWLYRNWHNTNRALRSYLFAAVIILSLITSMGIFGFLSKAHLETNFQSSNNSQQISIINSQIKAEQDVIDRQTEIIKRNSGAGGGSGERIAQLRERIKQMDKEVEAYTSQGSTSTIFNDKVAKGIALKESQKAERDKIDAEIKQLTSANQGNNSAAEAQIARSQQRIQQLINQRAPLQSAQIKIDAEIGPIKYIGALAVDVGLAKEVNVEAAVRWVIIIIIFVFDPLAVLMLVAANQSFAARFPTLMEKPRDIIDLERPDIDLPPVIEPKNNIIDNIKKKYESQLKDWQEKLAKFNEKAPKPEPKTIEIVPVKEEKKAEDTVSYVIKDAIEIKTAETDSEKKRPEEIITQYNEPEENTGRTRPNFTEVVEPENKSFVGRLGQVFVKKNKPVKLETSPKIDPIESKKKLEAFHKENGLFQDATEEDLKKERDEINRQQFLNAVPVTENDSKNHLPITASRRKYFQDYVDDVLRGTVTAEQLPEDIAHTVALILSEHPDPAIIEDKKSTYVQNEEQKDSNGWSKILEVKEPEKNEIILPNIPSTPTEDIHDIAESITVEAKIPQEKITKHKIKMLSNDEYRRRIEDRINALITKIEQGEIKLTDLSVEDQQVIIGLMNSNE
jgi:hypothetical protein